MEDDPSLVPLGVLRTLKGRVWLYCIVRLWTATALLYRIHVLYREIDMYLLIQTPMSHSHEPCGCRDVSEKSHRESHSVNGRLGRTI